MGILEKYSSQRYRKSDMSISGISIFRHTPFLPDPFFVEYLDANSTLLLHFHRTNNAFKVYQ
jgi:hypothetical protein